MTVLFSTGFESDAVGGLPSGWTADIGAWAVTTSNPTAGSQCLGTSPAADGNRVRLTGKVAQGDTKWQVDFKNLGASQGYAPMARISANAQNGYLLQIAPGSGGGNVAVLQFYRMDAGGFTAIGSTVTTAVNTCNAGDIMHAEILCNGSVLEGRYWSNNGSRPSSPTISTTDAAYATGQVGVRYTQNTIQGQNGFDSVVLSDLTPGSNPGVGSKTLDSINTAAFRQHLKDNALTPNLHSSFSGAFIYPYITPAAFYGNNQFVHDACYWCIASAASGDSTLVAAGKLALLNFGQTQHADGFVSQAMAASGDTTQAISNPPMIPTAALAMHAFAPDIGWLGQIYPIAKGMHQWLAANRTDPVTHLAAWGTKNINASVDVGDGTPQPDTQASLEGQDDIGYIYKEFEYSRLLPVAPGAQTRVNLNMPDTSSYLAGSARDLATIAGLIGNTADQAAFTAEYAMWKTRINKWLWDATTGSFGRYGMHQDSTDWYNPGATVATAVGIGDTTMQIAVPRNKAMAIVPGMSIICGAVGADGDALIIQRATETASVSGTNATITVPISVATQTVPAGAMVRTALFTHLQTEPTQVMPLWAGVPSPAQASATANELMQSLDGTAADGVRIDFSPWISNPASTGSSGVRPTDTTGRYSLDKYQSVSTRAVGAGLTDWIPEWTGDSAQPRFVDSATFDGLQLSDNTQFIAFQRRWFNTPLGSVAKTIYDTTLESVSAAYPLTIKVLHVAGSARPIIAISDIASNTVLAATPFGTTGSGAIVTSTYTFAPTTPVVIGQVQLSAETGNLNIKAVTLTEKPRGFSYLSPFGPVVQPRFSRHSYAMLYDDPRDYSTSFGNHQSSFPDYWKGEIAPYFTWHLVKGLSAYGLTSSARDVALRYCAAAYNEYQAFLADSSVGACREWLGMNGAMKGAAQYGWAALPIAIMASLQSMTTRIGRIPLGLLN